MSVGVAHCRDEEAQQMRRSVDSNPASGFLTNIPEERAKFLADIEALKSDVNAMKVCSDEQEAKLSHARQKLQQVTVNPRSHHTSTISPRCTSSSCHHTDGLPQALHVWVPAGLANLHPPGRFPSWCSIQQASIGCRSGRSEWRTACGRPARKPSN